MIKKTVAAFLTILILNIPSFAETIYVDFIEYSPTSVLARAALIPGWGQFHNERYTKGYIVSGMFALSAIGMFYFYEDAQRSYDKYQKAGLMESEYFSDYETSNSKSNYCMYAAFVCWVYGMADAYFIAKSEAEYSEQYKYQSRRQNGLKLCFQKEDLKLAYSKCF